MIVELGHVALLIAFALAVVQSVVPVWGAYIGARRMMASADSSAMGILVFTALSFGALMWAYLQSDFSVVNVWQNSHSDMPTLFKITGTWGNHEGSMLLWVLILALFAAAVSVFGGNLPERLRANVQGVQAWMLATFFAFIIWTSNPFARQPTAIEGQDLTGGTHVVVFLLDVAEVFLGKTIRVLGTGLADVLVAALVTLDQTQLAFGERFLADDVVEIRQHGRVRRGRQEHVFELPEGVSAENRTFKIGGHVRDVVFAVVDVEVVTPELEDDFLELPGRMDRTIQHRVAQLFLNIVAETVALPLVFGGFVSAVGRAVGRNRLLQIHGQRRVPLGHRIEHGVGFDRTRFELLAGPGLPAHFHHAIHVAGTRAEGQAVQHVKRFFAFG